MTLFLKFYFPGKLSEDLKTPNKFYTKFVSEIEEEKLGDLAPITKQVRTKRQLSPFHACARLVLTEAMIVI